jgi:hypothetical protein
MLSRRFIPLLLLTAVITSAGSFAAFAAPGAAKLKLSKTSLPPKTLAAGDEYVVKATVKNTGSRGGSGVLKFGLRGGGDYTLPTRNFRVPTGRVGPLTFKRFTVRLTIPAATSPGKYRLATCLKVKGVERCRVSRTIRVTS